eukprot:840543-Amphidinium_carterae.1
MELREAPHSVVKLYGYCSSEALRRGTVPTRSDRGTFAKKYFLPSKGIAHEVRHVLRGVETISLPRVNLWNRSVKSKTQTKEASPRQNVPNSLKGAMTMIETVLLAFSNQLKLELHEIASLQSRVVSNYGSSFPPRLGGVLPNQLAKQARAPRGEQRPC